jgi:teichuronic acid exporter
MVVTGLPLSRRAFSGVLLMLASTGFQAVLSIGVLAILARLLSPADFGLVTAAMIIVAFSQLFGQMGIGPAIVQKPVLSPTHRKVGFTAALLFGVLIGLLVAASAPLVAAFFRQPEITPIVQVMAFVFPVSAVSAVADGLLQREMKFKQIALINSFSYLVGYGAVGTVFALLGAGAWSLVAAQLGLALVRASISVVLERHSMGLSLRLTELRELVGYGAGFSLTRIANYFANQFDNIVVGRALGVDMLGIYSRSHQLMMAPANLLGSAADRVLFPVFASVQGDQVRLTRSFMRTLDAITLVATPISVVSVITAPEIVTVLLGDKWTAVVLPFQLLVATLVFRSAYKICDSLVRAVGAIKRHASNQAVFATLVLAGSVAGAGFGLPGVAAGVAIAILTSYGLMLRLCASLVSIPLKSFVVVFARNAAFAVLAALVAIVCRRTMVMAGYPPLVVLAAVGTGVFATYFAVALMRPSALGPEGVWFTSLVKTSLFRTPAPQRT